MPLADIIEEFMLKENSFADAKNSTCTATLDKKTPPSKDHSGESLSYKI
jgi:hypothetical protein